MTQIQIQSVKNAKNDLLRGYITLDRYNEIYQSILLGIPYNGVTKNLK